MNGNNLTRHILLMVAAVGLLLSCAGAGERARMAALLEKVEQMDQDYLPLDTVTFMEEVLDFYMAHGNEDERIRANYMMGGVYRDRGDSPMALEYYLKAVNQADTTDENCNFKKIGRIYGQMADLFHKQRYPQKEIEAWWNAIYNARKAKDTLMIYSSMDHLSSGYKLLGDTVKALRLSRGVYNLCLKTGDSVLATSPLVTIFTYYLDKDSLQLAKKAIDEYKQNSSFFNEQGQIDEEHTYFNYYLGNYYYKVGAYDSALIFYSTLIHSKDIEVLEGAYKGLMYTYRSLNLVDSAMHYAQLFSNANDTANRRNSANEISRAQMLYDYSENQKIAAQKTLENTRLRYFIFISVIVSLMIIYILYYKHKRKKIKLININAQYNNTLNQYLTAKKEIQHFKADKESFEQEKSKEIETLRNTLSAYQTNINLDTWDSEQDLLQHPVVLAMHRHACVGKSPAESEWTDLDEIIKKILPDFHEKISNPENKLIEREYKICLLTRLQFLPSEVATLMNFSKQRVSNLRSNANKKLFNKSGSKTFDWNIHNI